MWKAAAAFILAIGAGGFVAGSVLGDPGPPDVGDPVVLNENGSANQPPGTDAPTARPTDDDGTADQGGGNDDDAEDDLDTIYHSPDDLSDDGHGRGRGRGGDDARDDHGGHGSGIDSSGHGSGHDSGGHSGSDD